VKPGPISKSSNGWELKVLADGSLSCDNFNLGCDDIDTVYCTLRKQFEKRMKKAHIHVSFDNWSGVFIMHIPGFYSQKGDDLIREIYAFLSNEDK
jgi:hypothetical protein